MIYMIYIYIYIYILILYNIYHMIFLLLYCNSNILQYTQEYYCIYSLRVPYVQYPVHTYHIILTTYI